MNLEKSCYLKKGDYLLLPAVDKSEEYGYESFFMAEKISKLNYPKEGDFTTIKGTTGPNKGKSLH